MAQTRRWSCGDSSSTYSDEEKHPGVLKPRFGLASFTEDDLAAISRRKPRAAIPTGHAASVPTRCMTPLAEEQYENHDDDDDSVVSTIPTGLRAQQEALSSLQKENFRLKLSLHSYRRKETLRTAQLESASSALRDFDCRKRALEKTLKHLRGEIIAGYRSLERLVSEQADANGKEEFNKSCDTSGCHDSAPVADGNIARGDCHPIRTASLPRRSSRSAILENSRGPSTRSYERYSREGNYPDAKIVLSNATPIPTRRHFIETQDDDRGIPRTGKVKSSNEEDNARNNHKTWSHRLISARNRGRLSTVEEPSEMSTKNKSYSSDPWLSDEVHQSNPRTTDSYTAPLRRFLKQSQGRKMAPTNSSIDVCQLPSTLSTEKPAEPDHQRTKPPKKGKIFCGIRLFRHNQHHLHAATRKTSTGHGRQRNVRHWIPALSRKVSSISPAPGRPKRQHRKRRVKLGGDVVDATV